MYQPDLAALQSGNGDDDLTVVATITMQSEESLGLDSANVQQQEASLGGQAVPQVQEEVKEEEKVELPPEKSPEPTPLVEEEKPEKKIVEVNPSIPTPSSEAQEEQRAATRALEARRNEVLSLYNSRVYQALIKNALRPKATQKGRVVVELTLAPSGELLDHHVVESSGSPMLDKTAMTSLERAAPFPPVPAEVSKQSHTLRVPFEYAVK
jgi:protein TonB